MRMMNALNFGSGTQNGLKVGFADFNDKSVEWLEGPETFDEWMKDVDLYGAAEKYQATRMLISKN